MTERLEWMRRAADEIVRLIASYQETGGEIGHPANNGRAVVLEIIARHAEGAQF